jgi:hypothetical protein
MARNSKSAAEVHGSVWVALIGAVVLIAGCSAPVLRTPSFVDAPRL